MKLKQQMIDLVDDLCGMETSLEVEEKLIKLATLMQDEQNKMAIRHGDEFLDDNWGHNNG